MNEEPHQDLATVRTIKVRGDLPRRGIWPAPSRAIWVSASDEAAGPSNDLQGLSK